MFEKAGVDLLSCLYVGCEWKGPFIKTHQLILHGKISVALSSLTSSFLVKNKKKKKERRRGFYLYGLLRGGGNNMKAIIYLIE